MSSSIKLPQLGIKEIDDQHGHLITCLDRLELWVGKGRGYSAALDALNSLNEYVASHFSYEEAFMQEHGFPQLEEHIEKHSEIRTELERLTRQVFDGADISAELPGLIREWIIDHVGVEDLGLAEFLAKAR